MFQGACIHASRSLIILKLKLKIQYNYVLYINYVLCLILWIFDVNDIINYFYHDKNNLKL